MSRSSIGHAHTVALIGLAGHLVDVQVHVANGLPALQLVGLPDAAVKEARHRVRAALASIGIGVGNRRCTINLAPANVPKTGTSFDLAIAAALLRAQSNLTVDQEIVFIGELGLDGTVVSVPGVLPMVKAARDSGSSTVVVAAASAQEARLIPGIRVEPVSHISQIAEFCGLEIAEKSSRSEQPVIVTARGTADKPRLQEQTHPTGSAMRLDMNEVLGQEAARWALEVVAAGGHHWYMVGSPGAGKTMLAQRLPTVLPALNDEQALEVTAIHSLTSINTAALIRTPPFEAPHHGVSLPAMVGGGSRIARPGAISRAHHGILFLDEAPEFAPTVLDSLRQPLESGQITIERVLSAATYPARFQLVMAANPCPCGYWGVRGKRCQCSPLQRVRYQHRISGPLFDRVDVITKVNMPTSASLAIAQKPENSATIATRVGNARAVAEARWQQYGFTLNARIPSHILRSERWLAKDARRVIQNSVNRGVVTMRGADKILRIAWTLADLAGHGSPTQDDVFGAYALRGQGTTDEI